MQCVSRDRRRLELENADAIYRCVNERFGRGVLEERGKPMPSTIGAFLWSLGGCENRTVSCLVVACITYSKYVKRENRLGSSVEELDASPGPVLHHR